MPYDGPDYAIQTINAQVTGAASASMQKFLMYRATILERISALVVTAGTNTDAAVDVIVGTDTVSTFAFGTNTAGVLLDSGVLNVEVPAGGAVELKGRANSATLVGAFQLQVRLDATP